MKNIRKKFLRWVVVLPLVTVSFYTLAQTDDTNPAVAQGLPSLLGAEVSDWLRRGDFETAQKKCSLDIKLAPLVSEPGDLAESYLCLGEALYGLKRYPASVEAFSKAVADLEASVGVFDPLLVQPLEGLGKALMAIGQSSDAEQALAQAKDITHRNFGIYNVVQSSISSRLAKTYFDRSQWLKADREQKFLLRANVETYGDTPQLLPALRRYAKFQELIGRADLARESYRRALNIMKRAYGTDDIRLIGPLRDFARSYSNMPRGSARVMTGSGAQALRDVVDLYSRQEFSDRVDVAKAWTELGDWYVISGQPGKARGAYTEAGTMLAGAGDDNNDMFSKPVEIEFEETPVWLRRSQLRSFPKEVSSIEFDFTVTAAGRVTGITVVQDDFNSVRYRTDLVELVRNSRYRPRLVDGVPVATSGVRKVFRFDFSQFEIDNSRRQKAQETVEEEQGSGEEKSESEQPEEPTSK